MKFNCVCNTFVFDFGSDTCIFVFSVVAEGILLFSFLYFKHNELSVYQTHLTRPAFQVHPHGKGQTSEVNIRQNSPSVAGVCRVMGTGSFEPQTNARVPSAEGICIKR